MQYLKPQRSPPLGLFVGQSFVSTSQRIRKSLNFVSFPCRSSRPQFDGFWCFAVSDPLPPSATRYRENCRDYLIDADESAWLVLHLCASSFSYDGCRIAGCFFASEAPKKTPYFLSLWPPFIRFTLQKFSHFSANGFKRSISALSLWFSALRIIVSASHLLHS
jgi:hypothetical protein